MLEGGASRELPLSWVSLRVFVVQAGALGLERRTAAEVLKKRQVGTMSRILSPPHASFFNMFIHSEPCRHQDITFIYWERSD